MKRISLIIILGLLFFNLKAQSLSVLKEENRINIEFDFTNTIFNGLTFEDFEVTETDWTKDEPRIKGKFFSSFNKTLKEPLGGAIKNADYTVRVYPQSIDEDGNIKAYFEVTDKENNVIYKSDYIKGKGGRFGSFLNLMGDGMQSLGKKVASEIKKNMK